MLFLLLLSLFNFDPPYDGTVIVSWYGRPFHGKTTASGIPFNMFELTAAHCTLPLGTIVDGRNPENGITLQFRVTDTGPWRYNSKGYATWPLEEHPVRKFDLSMKAYLILSGGNLDSGVMPMQYTVVGRNAKGLPYARK